MIFARNTFLNSALSFGLAGLIFIASCTSKDVTNKRGRSESGRDSNAGHCLKVVNGIEAVQYPGVVMLINENSQTLCTGTFLGDNVVLTAAHCLDNTATGGLKVAGGPSPIAVFHGGITGDNVPNLRPLKDIALLLFSTSVSPVWRKIASVAPRAGDSLTVIGYGQTDFIHDNAIDGKVRFGQNQIDGVDPTNGTLLYHSPIDYKGLGAGQESMSGRGDSGGPLIVGNGVVALTSGGDVDQSNLIEQDFLLFSRIALDVIEAAEAKGAHINGTNHVREFLGVAPKSGALDEDTATKNQPVANGECG